MIEVTYLGYGTHASWQVMEKLIGRIPQGCTAVLPDHELAIQQPHEIPIAVRSILGVHRTPDEVASFRAYAARPMLGAHLVGMAWQLTPREREMMGHWNINGLWFEEIDVQLEQEGGQAIPGTTEVIDDSGLTPAEILEPLMPTFLNNRRRTLALAQLVSRAFFADKAA